VAGATVTTREASTGVKHTIASDERGFYSFQNVPVGNYDIKIDASSFKPLLRTNVVVDVGSKVVVDGTLSIGEKTETITIAETVFNPVWFPSPG
jgi:LDH2 family malate/lactate/ureidoglycolate dehydrogenase